jgi:hypothetical protein
MITRIDELNGHQRCFHHKCSNDLVHCFLYRQLLGNSFVFVEVSFYLRKRAFC